MSPIEQDEPERSESPKGIEELRREYQERLLAVFQALRAHRGAEATYQEFMQRSIELERWMVEVFGNEGKSRLSIERETEISSEFRKSIHAITLDRILDMASKRLERLDDLDVLTIRTNSVILPTESRNFDTGSGNGIDPIQERPKFMQLIALLQRNGVYTDDVVVIEGSVPSHMVRSLPYRLVELPRLHRQVLVCDEVGEATFVVQDMLSHVAFSQNTKEQLLDKYPKTVRIRYHNQNQWEASVWTALVDESSGERIGDKVDVAAREKMRQLIMQKYSPEQWLANNSRGRREVVIGGKKMIGIARIFGFDRSVLSNNMQWLKFSQQIWGADESVIADALLGAQLDKNQACLLIKQAYRPEQWVNISGKDRVKIKIAGHGMRAVALLLGFVQDDIYGKKQAWLELGQAIWGLDEPVIAQALRTEKMSAEDIRLEAKREYTPNDWVQIQWQKRRQVTIAGRGLGALKTAFGIQGKENDRSKILFLEIGQAIWGKDEPIIAEALRAEHVNRAMIQAEIKERFTPEEWLLMGHKEQIKIHVQGKGTTALLSLFEVDREITGTTLLWLELGAAIWGADEPIIKEALEQERTRKNKPSTKNDGASTTLSPRTED